jgi:DNA-3-methyladenine glycosylase II
MRSFVVTPKGPFSWSLAGDVLRSFAPVLRHGRTSDREVVRMAFPLDGDHAPVAVALRWTGTELRGEIAGASPPDEEAVARQVARIFSLDHDASGYPEIGRRNPEIGRLMTAFPGLRPVCFTSPYECAAWAVISQRIAKTQASRILDTLVTDHGHALEIAGQTVRAFPEPARLRRLRALPGLSAPKIARLRAVAGAALDGRLDPERLRQLGDERAPEILRTIPGIGPFWASGIYLRACGIADAFPEEPLWVAALGAIHGLGDRPDPEIVRRITEAYRPFRMWTCFLLRIAAARGEIPGITERAGAIRSAARGPGVRRALPRERAVVTPSAVVCSATDVPARADPRAGRASPRPRSAR